MPQVLMSRAQLCSALLTAVFLALGFVPTAAAQETADDPWAGVEEMVVSGSSVLDALTSSTVSVTAFDSSDLEAIGASDVSDVAAFTPNLEIRTAGSTTATLFIRGVGLNDFTANAAGSVAVYEDDVPKNLPAIQLGQLFDVEGVTVLKGPQGSGPGRNASAGAIKVYTKKPTGDFGGFVSIDYGNYNLVKVEGALEVPIIPDVLSTRAAFSVEKRDGTVFNRCGGITQEEYDASSASELCGGAFKEDLRPGLDTDLNDIDVWAGRLTTRYIPPVEDMEWLFSFHGSRRDQLGTVGESLGAVNVLGSADSQGYRQPEITDQLLRIRQELRNTVDFPTNAECAQMFPNDPAARVECRNLLTSTANQLNGESLANRPLDVLPFEGAYNRPGYERQTTWGGFLKGEWEFETFRIKSITGFERYDRERLIDADYSPNIIFEFEIEDDAWQASQDIQISGELEDFPVTWNTGLFYLQERLDYAQNTLARNPLEPSFGGYIQDTNSFGLFGEFEWDFMDDFTLEAGGRYNWERKRFDAQIVRNPGLPGETLRCLPPTDGSPPPQCTRTVTVDHPTGTVGIRYAIDELRDVYMKFSHGWKGAQFNQRDGSVAKAVTDVADPEVIDAFEIGFGGSWWDERFSLNGAFFWYQYKNYQVFTFTNNAGETPQRVVVNADDAQLYGAELESRFEPIDRLIFELRAGWIESQFLDFTDAVVRRTESQGNKRIVTDFNGNSLPNAPQFKVSGNVSYDFELRHMGTLTPRYDFTWSDDVYFDPSEGRGSPDADGLTFMPENTIGQEALI
jgi:iron complex outermembrane receptor protein